MLRTLLLALLAMLVASCDQEAYFQKFVPQAEAEEGKRVLELVATRQFDALEARLDATLRSAEARAKLEQLAAMMPTDPPRSVATIGAHTRHVDSDVSYSLTYEYEYPGRWLIANVVLERKADQLRVAGVHLYPQTRSQREANAFTLDGKGPAHYAMLALAAAIPIFVLATLVACIRTKGVRRKWLWILFVAVGLVQVSLNWTTGQMNFMPLSFLLLGAGYSRAGPWAPYVLTIAAPVGAIVFLMRRRQLSAQSNAAL